MDTPNGLPVTPVKTWERLLGTGCVHITQLLPTITHCYITQNYKLLLHNYYKTLHIVITQLLQNITHCYYTIITKHYTIVVLNGCGSCGHLLQHIK
jgi:hypothetical protein